MARTRSPAKLWINQEIKAGRRKAMPVIALGLAGTALALVQIFCAARLLAATLRPQHQAIFSFALGFAAAAALRALLMIRQDAAGVALGIKARRRLRNAALTSLLGMGPGALRDHHSAGLASIVMDQIEALDGLHARWIAAASLASAAPLLIVIVAALVDWRTAVILAIAGILVPFAMAIAGIGAGAAARRQFTAMSRLQIRFIDRVRGIATIVLSGRADDEAKALGQAADELRRRTMRVLRVAFLSSIALDLAAAAALVAIAIRFAGPLIATHGSIAPEALFALLLVPEFFAPLRAFSAVYQDRMAAQTVAEELVTLQAPPRDPSPPPIIRTVSAQGVAIAFEQVSFAWDAERGKALDHLSFRLPAGETMMLVGPSGSGKSTIIELLLGYIRPQSGRITINGAPIESIVPEALAGMTALISQKPFLFSGTIEANIRLGRADASADAVLEAAKRARLTSFTDELPDGLATRIGEGGYGLSGGQAQRIAIARAFLKDVKLLLLDEPTAQLDPATEGDVLDSLKRLAIGRTVILASHAAFAHEFAGRKLDLGNPAREATLAGAA